MLGESVAIASVDKSCIAAFGRGGMSHSARMVWTASSDGLHASACMQVSLVRTYLFRRTGRLVANPLHVSAEVLV